MHPSRRCGHPAMPAGHVEGMKIPAAATVLLDAQLRDQLRTADRGDTGSLGNVCPKCKSETTRLYAGSMCPRCLDVDRLGSTNVGPHTSPLLPSREPRAVYSPASRRSEIELGAREAEAREAEGRLQAVLRRGPPAFSAVQASATARPASPRRDLEGDGLALGFSSRSSPRLDQLLRDFPDDSPSRANHRTPHAPRSPDSRLAELTVEARARTLSFSPLPD